MKEQREEVVIKRLVDIKKAQEEYYSQNNEYAPDFETLIEFVRTGRMGVVRKIYELNDEQQAYILSYVNDQIKKDNKKRRNSEQVEEYHGLTNNQADSVFLVILAEAKEKDDWKVFDAIEKKKSPHQTLSLKEFSRDTTWINLRDTLYHNPNYPADSLEFIPFGNGEKFVMETGADQVRIELAKWALSSNETAAEAAKAEAKKAQAAKAKEKAAKKAEKNL